MAQLASDVPQATLNQKTKQLPLNYFWPQATASGSTTSSDSHSDSSGAELDTTMGITRENESSPDTASPAKKPRLSQDGGSSDSYICGTSHVDVTCSNGSSGSNGNHVEDSAAQSAENTSAGKSTKRKVKVERLPEVSFTQIKMDKFRNISSDMDKIMDRIFKARSDCEEKYVRGDPDNAELNTGEFKQQGFCCITESKETPFSKLGFHHKKTNDHYIIFYHRINKVNHQPEMFAVTTGQAWRVVQKFADYDFPKKIANRILCKEGAFKRSEVPLFGPKRKVSTLFKNLTHPNKLQPYYIKSSSSKLRKNASIFKLKCFTCPEPPVKVSCQIIRFEHRFRLEDMKPIVDHLSQISRGEETKTFEDGQETDTIEEDCPEAHSNNLVEVTFSDKIELDNALQRLLSDTLNRAEGLQKLPGKENDNNSIDNFDLSYKHFEDFIKGHYFELRFMAKKEVTMIKHWDKCPKLMSVITEIRNSVQYKKFTGSGKRDKKFPTWFSKLRFTFINEYGQEPQNQTLLQFLHGDLMKDEKIYWHMDNQWLQFTDDYLFLLNSEFKNVIQKSLIKKGSSGYLEELYSKVNIPPEESNKVEEKEEMKNKVVVEEEEEEEEVVVEEEEKEEEEKEKEEEKAKKKKKIKYEEIYNKKYEDTINFIVGDRETVYHIELFDLLFYDEENDQIFLYHVKEGFEQKTRDACSQLANSVEMLSNILLGRIPPDHKNVLENLYNAFVLKCRKKVKEGKQIMPKICDSFAEFKKALRNAHFVYAFPDTTKSDPTKETRSFLMEMEKKNTIDKQDLEDKLSELGDDKTLECLSRGLDCENSWADVTDAIISKLKKCGYADSQTLNITAKLIHSTKGKGRFKKEGLKWLVDDKMSPETSKEAALAAVFDQLFKLYCTSYDTLIGKFELNRVRDIVVKKGFTFKICEIEVDEATKTPKMKVGEAKKNSKKKRSK